MLIIYISMWLMILYKKKTKFKTKADPPIHNNYQYIQDRTINTVYIRILQVVFQCLLLQRKN